MISSECGYVLRRSTKLASTKPFWIPYSHNDYGWLGTHRSGLLNQLANVAGALASYLLSLSGNWRWIFACTAVPVAIFWVGSFFIPENPRWLVLRNREEEASKSFPSCRSLANHTRIRLRSVQQAFPPRANNAIAPGWDRRSDSSPNTNLVVFDLFPELACVSQNNVFLWMNRPAFAAL